MAEKMSTLVLKVDLDCWKCYNKMRKTLCQLHCEIRSQTWDKKQNTITISGPFDPQNMSTKLERKAGKVIKGIEIKGDGKKVDDKPKAADAKPGKPAAGGDKPAAPDKKPDKKPEGDKPADKKPEGEKPAEKKPAAAAAEKPPEKAADAPKAAEMKMYEPMTVLAYPVAQQPYGVYYQGYEGYEVAPPPYYHGYGRPVYNYGANRGYVHGSDYFSEENPTCTIM